MRQKYKYLIKNVGLLTLSSFATKLLSFFLVPLYTNVLSTGEYGTYDLLSTTVSLLVPILSADIQEAVLRFALDDDIESQKVLTVGIRCFSIGCLIIIFFTIINNYFSLLIVLKNYTLEFVFLYIFTSINGIVTCYARGVGNVKELSVSSVIASLISITCNIVFLLGIKLGLLGYFYATILGSGFQTIYLLTKLHSWSSFRITNTSKKLQHAMIEYSSPMIANAVSWWINNASDRYIVTLFCGIEANGIYSVSYKIPSIINILQSIFGQAWSISAVKELDLEDKSGFFINVYNLYNFLLVVACSVLIFFDKVIAKILFAKDFYLAWKYAPFLLISVVFSGMAAFIGGLLSALKKSESFAKTSVITAVLNTLGNIGLVYFIGPVGASISTAAAYFLMWILRLKIIKKDISLRVNFKRDIIVYFILIIQAILILFINTDRLLDFYQSIFVIAIFFLFRKEVFYIISKIHSVSRK